ncbi:MAG: single-stranded-DNA-specific exonuclease RecJ, partial [Verrucomicrobiae bacterium]|nr:single-stranded-DNA-specific exonuclease RecJ [Verrucomicrobiae bacterium]
MTERAAKRWVVAPPPPPDALAHLPRPIAAVLWHRGIHDRESAERFLHPRLSHLRDPLALPGMTAAVARVLRAIDDREPIVVYGDYDVDGITACALLTKAFRVLGAQTAYFLPRRLDEGYGLSRSALQRCCRQHRPRLLIAVDCGIASVQEVAHLQATDTDVIILDHHEPGSQLPPATAVVNPKLEAGHAPLAAVGVAFKLIHALAKTRPAYRAMLDLRALLDLVALGTIADLVPLIGENRIVARHGLQQLADTNRVGLRALCELAAVHPPITPGHIGYRLGPRLNAAGRLADAEAALELLLTEDAARARQLATLLNEHNAARQQVEETIFRNARVQAERAAETGARVLVVADPTWHVGVIGIVAARLMQEFYRPVIVIGAGGKGSARSIPGFSIIAALRACDRWLSNYGGHELAAGLTVQPTHEAALQSELDAYAATALPAEEWQPKLHLDAELSLGDLNEELFQRLKDLEPFGVENPTPCFVTRRVQVRGTPTVLGKSHLRFSVTDGQRTLPAIWWGHADHELPRGAFDLAFEAETENY